MGGLGSGQRNGTTRRRTEALPSVNLPAMRRAGLLTDCSLGRIWLADELPALVFVRNLTATLVVRPPAGGFLAWSVNLAKTPCRFGGVRSWLVCPERSCSRQVTKLYIVAGKLLCRHCHGLAYESQLEDRRDRQLRKARNTRIRLGGSPNLLDDFPAKPPRMWFETYERVRPLRVTRSMKSARIGFPRRIDALVLA